MTTHAIEGFGDCRRATIGKPRYDRATSEYLRIGRQHHICHGAASRKASDKNSLTIEPIRFDHCLDHLADGERFPPAAPNISRRKPIEAKIGIVGPSLFGEENGEPLLDRELRPAGTMIIGGCTLRTTMEDDDQRCSIFQIFGDEEACSQGARIGTELGNLGKTRMAGWLGETRSATRRRKAGNRI